MASGMSGQGPAGGFPGHIAVQVASALQQSLQPATPFLGNSAHSDLETQKAYQVGAHVASLAQVHEPATGSRAPPPGWDGHGAAEKHQEPTFGARAIPPLHLTVHRVDGNLCTSMATPFVRVHVVDAATGHWRQKAPGRRIVFNMDGSCHPFVRASTGRHEPWQVDGSQSSYVRPFATLPRALQRTRASAQRALPSWDESFLLAEPLERGSVLLFEVIDVVAENQKGEDGQTLLHYEPIAWGFLGIDAVLGTGGHRCTRRLRVQLFKYRRRRRRSDIGRSRDSSAAGSDFEESGGRSGVCEEYRDTSVGQYSSQSGVFASLLAHLTCRSRRERWPAALEMTLSPAQRTLDLDKALEALNIELSRTHVGGTAAADISGISGIVAGDVTVDSGQVAHGSGDEAQHGNKLAPHNLRPKDGPCALPSSLLWQIAAGKRGASRLCFSPSGRLIAAAVARPGGATELRVFSVASGRLHAACMATHDTLVYDLCWHSFTVRGAPMGKWNSSHPLLISCGGDSVVQVYEVPEELPKGRNAPLLRPHARLQLPSHVYSVRPHPAMSTDPRRLVLMCGGHRFGLVICEIGRTWQQAASRDGGKWVTNPQHHIEPVKYELSHLRQAGGTVYLADPGQEHRTDGDPSSDVLCVRFSNQLTQADSLYASTASGHLMLFQVRFDAAMEAGRGGVRAGLVRSYAAPEMLGTPIYSMEVVTQQLVQGKRLTQVQLSMVDDWVLLFSRDHVVRLASLQRGILRIEMEMTGLESGTYPVRGCMSPDAQYIACGSETGELLVWGAADGKLLPVSAAPQVRLAGPVMDVAWSDHHHLLACCAVDDQAPPILLFAGGDPDAPPPTLASPRRQDILLPRPSPIRESPLPPSREELSMMMPSSIAPAAALTAHKWAAQWLHADGNPRSVLTLQEKQHMKQQILAQLLDKKSAAELEQHFMSAHGLPGGL